MRMIAVIDDEAVAAKILSCKVGARRRSRLSPVRFPSAPFRTRRAAFVPHRALHRRSREVHPRRRLTSYLRQTNEYPAQSPWHRASYRRPSAHQELSLGALRPTRGDAAAHHRARVGHAGRRNPGRAMDPRPSGGEGAPANQAPWRAPAAGGGASSTALGRLDPGAIRARRSWRATGSRVVPFSPSRQKPAAPGEKAREAIKPKWRILTKPLGSTCNRKGR